MPPSKADMLKWFTEDERNECSACGKNASVSVADAHTSFCLACGAISLDGKRIDIDRRIPT